MRKSWLWVPGGLALLAAGSFAAFEFLQPPSVPPGLLYGNGHVEGVEIRLTSEVTGRVIESRLQEGQPVAAGDLLLRVDDSDLRIQLRQLQAERMALVQQKGGLVSELGAVRHHRQTSGNDVERYRRLKDKGVVPEQRLDQAENQLQESKGRQASLQEQVGAADDLLAAAQERIRLLESQLGKTEIRAPRAGTILTKLVEPGEYLTPGRPVAILVDMRQLELKVFVPEADLGKVRLGAPVRVKVSAFPARLFEARVARVDSQAQFTPRDIHVPEERVRMVFGVTLALANPDGELKPGMPADAWIRWQDAATWPDRLVAPQ